MNKDEFHFLIPYLYSQFTFNIKGERSMQLRLHKKLKFSVCYILLSVPMLTGQVIINEFMPSNTIYVQDEDLEYSDWIEIYNTGTNSLNLRGYGLSDSESRPFKWVLPEMLIDPGAYQLIYASGKDRTFYAVEWETIIAQGDTCQYMPGTEEPPANWIQMDFDDSEWFSGATSIGFGDDDDATVIEETSTLYLRKLFQINDTTHINEVVLHMDYDDGFVAFLNGTEICRSKIGTPGIRPAFDEKADQSHEANLYRGESPEYFVIDDAKKKIVLGSNILAIQVHSYESKKVRDLTAIPFLSIGYSEAKNQSQGVSDLLTFPSYNLHTNFKLNNNGEYLSLTSPDGAFVDSVTYDSLKANISYGRLLNDPDTWTRFVTPTPGEANNNIYTGNTEVAAPVFSQDGGIYSNNFNLELMAPEGGTIYYTLDGSDPCDTSAVYDTPISIDVSQTTVMKAFILKEGFSPSPVVTKSYIQNRSYDHPVISIVMDPFHLWDYNEGIYVLGPNAEPHQPHFGANFWMDWEKPMHLDFFEPDGQHGFSLDAGITLFGGWSRDWPQKSFAVFARDKYGTDEIDYKIFPDETIDTFKSFILRNSGNDIQYTMMRDAMMQRLVKNFDLDDQAYRPAVVYLNGEYWGLYNIREKLNEDYLASHHGINPKKVDLLQSSESGQDGLIVEGDSLEYREIINFVSNHDMSVDANYQQIASKMDIENFILYQITEIYIYNRDWPHNNIKYWKAPDQNSKWRWMLYDLDFGFGLYDSEGYEFNALKWASEPYGGLSWPGMLLRHLLENQTFRNRFINRYADALNTNFSETTVIQTIDEMAENIKDELQYHFQKWPRDRSATWEEDIERLRIFARERVPFCRQHVIEKWNLDGTYDITLQNKNPDGGRLQMNACSISDESWSGTYFQGIPVQISAVPKPGYRFTGWTGAFDSDHLSLKISPIENLNLQANFEEHDNPSGSVVINEICYDSRKDFKTEDWIEIVNDSDLEFDLSLWELSDDDSNTCVIPQGTVLQANDFLILAQDTAAFKICFPDIENIISMEDLHLNKGHEHISLCDFSGFVVDSLTYDTYAPWPEPSDFSHFTVSLKDPALDNSQGANWLHSVGNGTPGKINDVIITGVVVTKQGRQIPTSCSLSQNYPNPFNPVTTISFSIVKSEWVTLKLYNLLGKEVMTLVNEKKSPGIYDVRLNASALPSGIYLYQLTTPSYKKTNKMSLLK